MDTTTSLTAAQRISLTVLRAVLVLAMVLTLLVQTVILPWLSGVVARDLPGEAYMRWPILAMAILGLLCVQAGMFAVWKLLGHIGRETMFLRASLRWVDLLVAAFFAAAAVCALTLALHLAVSLGPPGWLLLLAMGALAGVFAALLVLLMRALLVQGVAMRIELEGVI